MTAGKARSSEGPVARCALRPGKDCGIAHRGSPLALLGRRTGTGAWARGQPGWQRGMPRVDCLGESRMRENFMSGLGRGRWKRTRCGQGGECRGRPGNCPAGALLTYRHAPARTAPAPYFTRIIEGGLVVGRLLLRGLVDARPALDVFPAAVLKCSCNRSYREFVLREGRLQPFGAVRGPRGPAGRRFGSRRRQQHGDPFASVEGDGDEP